MGKEKKYSFREMEHIATNYAISCQKGYSGSFRDYMDNVDKDWRKWLKKKDKEYGIKNHQEIPYIPIKDMVKKNDAAEEYYKNYVSNGCDCLQMSCPICHG
jgi:hypothetical protein